MSFRVVGLGNLNTSTDIDNIYGDHCFKNQLYIQTFLLFLE